MSFRENLRSELDFQNIQTKELADKTGISKRTLDAYLAKNGCEPTVCNAVKIANALGVSAEYLANGICPDSPFSDIISELSRFSAEDVSAVRAVVKSISGKYSKSFYL